jgi:gas vesicle protein
MERACRENVVFMALACQHTPDHSTIANFVSSMQEEIERLFCDVLLVCEEMNLLGGSHFSLDGVKLSANVSKEWSGTFDELKHKRDKLQEKLQQVMAEHRQADAQPEVELERQQKRERRLQWAVRCARAA